MPLEDQEWHVVQQLVIDHLLVGHGDPLSALQLRFPEAVHWQIGQVASINAEVVVSAARGSSPLDPASLAIRLLQVLLTETRAAGRMEAEHVQKYLDRLTREAAAPQDDPFTALVLPGSGEVFINRTCSRGLLRSMVDPDPLKPHPLALRVDGEEQVGKSYTYSFISHLSARKGFAVVRVPLHVASTAEEVLLEIATHLGAEQDIPDSLTDPAKQCRQWAVWLVARAVRVQPRRAWWFVLDQCNELEEGAGAVELIAQLALAIKEVNVEPAYRPRLVLLGRCQALADLRLPDKQVFDDKVGVVSESEVRDFFSRVFRETESARCPTTEEGLDKVVEEAVREVFRIAEEQSQAHDTPFMQELAAAVEGSLDVYAG